MSSSSNTPPSGRLVLIPWHIGDEGDVTLNAISELKRLRFLLAEDPASLRRELTERFRIDCKQKDIRPIPHSVDHALIDWCVAELATSDIGMVASSGVPCFIDPGAWIVAELRSRGIAVRNHAGASALAAVLAASGIDWSSTAKTFTFHFYTERNTESLQTVLDREWEPAVLFLRSQEFDAVIKQMSYKYADRRVSAFFDMSKSTISFPYADQVETWTVKEWQTRSRAIQWENRSDVTLLIHPSFVLTL